MPAGTSPTPTLRHQVERASRPLLLRLHSWPRPVLPVITVGLVLVGVLAPPPADPPPPPPLPPGGDRPARRRRRRRHGGPPPARRVTGVVLVRVGVPAPPILGLLALAVVALFVAWIGYLSWPAVSASGRVLRVAMVGLVVVLALSRL